MAELLGGNLISVTLYGPSAKLTEEEMESAADGVEEFPILLVLTRLEGDTYAQLAEGITPWVEAGNPMPMIFTAERLAKSGDSFPVELLDMKESRKVLAGEDSILPLEVNRAQFQQELINNLKAELLRLRGQFLNDYKEPATLRRNLVFSYSHMSLLLRSTLRLFVPVSPTTFGKILEALKIHIPIDPDTFQTIHRLRAGKEDEENFDVRALFLRYLQEVEKLADGIDQLKIRRAGGATYPPFRS